MKTIDFILSYLREEATPEERHRVKRLLNPIEHPPIIPEVVVERLLTKCQVEWTIHRNKLGLVKYIKDVTGWGLKECKEWLEANVKLN
jgi:hypothetical protein